MDDNTTPQAPSFEEMAYQIGIDYGTPDGDNTCAMVCNSRTGDFFEVPVAFAEYIRTLQSENAETEAENEVLREQNSLAIEENATLRAESDNLRKRIDVYERGIGQASEQIANIISSL